MEKEKKKWETPQLICLYRGRPEEAVLQGCKTVGAAGPAHPSRDCTKQPCTSSTAAT